MAFCQKCGKEASGAFCAGCGSPVGVQSGVPVKKTRGKLLLLVLAVIVVTVIFIAKGIHDAGGVAAPAVGGPECSKNSVIYLELLKRGDGAAPRYWKQGVRPVTLFTVRDYKRIVQGEFLQASGKPYPIGRVYYRYEVESSTKGGIPIRKHWDVVLEPTTPNLNGTPCAIVAVNEAP
jgi:hypothetical protein